MTNLEYFFTNHPDAKCITDDGVSYPAAHDGCILCAKDAGVVDVCAAGEGFFDCRDCWCGKYKSVKSGIDVTKETEPTLTVADLIERLQTYRDDLPVYLENTDATISPLTDTYLRTLDTLRGHYLLLIPRF